MTKNLITQRKIKFKSQVQETKFIKLDTIFLKVKYELTAYSVKSGTYKRSLIIKNQVLHPNGCNLEPKG